MTNPVNVEFITERLLDFLRGTTDLFLKNILTKRVCSVAERYAPNNQWYIRTITQLFEVSGDMVKQEVAQNLMTLIAEGTGDSEEADMLLRQNAVELYVGLLRDKPGTATKLPRILLETIAWCLGEYGYLSAVCSLDDVLRELCTLAMTKARLATSTRKFLLSAIMKLVAQAGTCPPHAAAVIDDYTRSRDVDLQQRCLEFQTMLTTAPQILGDVFPVDASAEDVEMDSTLSFLNGYVNMALSSGARPYEKPEEDDDDDDLYDGTGLAESSGFKMTPYEKPQTPSSMATLSGMGSHKNMPSVPGVSLPPGSAYGVSAGAAKVQQIPAAAGEGLTLNTRNVANVWGKGGMGGGASQSSTSVVLAAPAAFSYANDASSNPYTSEVLASAPDPPKSKEQLEKERKAAMLFGGVVPGAAPPTAPGAPPPPIAEASIKSTTNASAPVPPPPPEADLLDMSMWDAPVPSTASAVDDIFGSAPVPLSTNLPPAAPAVETVSDEVEQKDESSSAKEMVGARTPQATEIDPFSAEGLLVDVQDAPLASLSTVQSKFEYNGVPLARMNITTSQFGQQWGSCKSVSPFEIQSSKSV